MRISFQYFLLAVAFTAANAQSDTTTIGVVQKNAATIGDQDQPAVQVKEPQQIVITSAPVPAPTAAAVLAPTAATIPAVTAAPIPAVTAAPVQKATVAPGPPTAAPTDSPAPSPSPSAIPTIPPTYSLAPTDKPTGEPTESPAPSPSPSALPTQLPSAKPSISPSGNPTRSMKPSSTPTMSQAPSNLPTGTPSKVPTGAPSSNPTTFPTRTPSVAPSSAPTEEAFKTKFSNTKIILMDIEREMNDDQLSEFEITTFQFVNDTAPHTDGYEIDILAVTLLSQKVIYPDAKNETNQGERRMQTSAALEVTFKTVGLVIEGRAPYDFDFKRDIVSVGFKEHMDQYYYILSKSDPYFEPLKAHTDIQDPVEEADEGRFVAAVVFSVIAFLVAVFASFYAIRRHLASKRRRLNRMRRMSDAHKSQTYSENSTDGSDEENNLFQPPLQLEISPGKMELENVPITPRSIASPFKRDYRNGKVSPKSPDTPKEAEPTVFEETGNAIRKWLTPRVTSPKESNFIDSKPPKPTSSPDPMALKASTTDATGTFTRGHPNLTKNASGKPANKMFGQSPLTIPMSFFGQNTDESEGETPMGSLAESAASSFFNRVGKSVFTGRPSNESYLQARHKFSPRESFDEDEGKKINDVIFGGRARSTPAIPPKNEEKNILSDENIKRHRTSYQPSEVSDVSLNDFKGGDKYGMIKAPSSVASARPSHYSHSSTLGARALEKSSDDNSLSALRSKPESYDVFAPSGPIGIVVDTSKDGPAVHSLKSTSPMMGLINPGDLIIALDDEDTRKMTAASLTRLMAKKSRQKERKITLLSMDGF